ncbi:unnamed protein product [Closterium sp. NIES-64]|nr:unnamed protein product [Closterium sp. NIES-64]
MRKYFLPNTAITEIIRLFKSKKWDVSDLEFWDTYRDLEEFEKEFVPGDEAWEAVDLELEGDFGTVTFRYRPVIQNALKGMAIVAGILLFSDSTHLTFNGRQFAHPLLMSLINIPEVFRWLVGGSEIIALFPSLPSDMSAEQKTAVMQTMLRIVLGPIMDVSTLKRRCKVIVSETPGGILRLPNIITYFRTLANYAAWEHRAMMQIVPLLVHLPGREDVGAAMVMFNEWYRAYFRVEFHTEESLKQCISSTEENTNWRDVCRDIAVRHERLASITAMAKEESGGKTYETAMCLAIEQHQRVLTKTSRTMTVGEPQDKTWTSYKLALGEDVMRRFSGELVRAGIVVSTLQVHTAVAIPPHTQMDTRDHGQLVKAAPDERKFSNIRIQGGGAEWYGKLLILFQFTGPDGAKVQRAFVKYYDEVSPPCPVTGCLRLVPTTGEDDYSVIEVDSILALAHIVPSFTDDDMFLVNRFLF